MSESNPTPGLTPAPHRVLRASAGAGKTYRLTGHYLDLLEAGAAPESILATTFTRKAAGEIFARVMTRLADGATSSPAARQRLLDLARHLDRVAIGTLDSFFNRLGNAFRFELDLPPDPQVVGDDSPIATRLRQRAIAELIDDAGGGQDDGASGFVALLNLLERLYHDEQSRSVTHAIDRVVNDHASVYEEAPDAAPWNWLAERPSPSDADLRAAADRIDALEGDLPLTGKGTPHANWLKSWRKDVEAASRLDSDTIIAAGIGKAVAEDAEKFSTKPIDDVFRAAYGPFVAHAKAERINRIVRQTAATHELMARFVSRYAALRREAGVLLYRDVPARLAALFAGQADAALDDLLLEMQFRVDASLTHLLLDEFQDTSRQQWRVLETFADEIAATADGSRTLFVVGDTKQAIYGWRGGCVELFEAAEERVPLEGREGLQTSYRSSPVVLNFVNGFFMGVADAPSLTRSTNDDANAADAAAADAWCGRFEPHAPVAHHADLPGYMTVQASPAAAKAPARDAYEADTDENESLDPTHEQFVASRITDLHHTAPHVTVGVLVGTNAAAAKMLLALRIAGLPASGEGGNSLAPDPAVSAVLAALTLADFPGDGPSRHQCRTSPLAEVLGLASTSGQAAGVAAGVAAARRIRAQLVRDGFAPTITRWAAACADACDVMQRQRLARLVELADDFDRTDDPVARLRPSRFVAHVEATRVEEASSAPIRVMTVHASKGLEFDAVVLPQLDQRKDYRADFLIDRDHPLGGISRVVRYPGKEARAAEPELAAMYRRNRQLRREEDLSGLYVALTRARHALYLLVKPAEPNDRGGWTGAGWAASLVRDVVGAPEDQTIEDGDPRWHAHVTGEAAGRTTQAPPAPVVLSAPPGPTTRRRSVASPSDADQRSGGALTAAALLRPAAAGAVAAGTAVHAAFAKVAYAPADSESDANAALPEAVRHALRFPAVRVALTPRYEREDAPWRERPFAVIDDDRLLKGVFDRVVVARDTDGYPSAAHLIDFKTDAVPEGDSAAAETKAADYAGQIDLYRAALSRLLNLPPDAITAELLFVNAGVSVRL